MDEKLTVQFWKSLKAGELLVISDERSIYRESDFDKAEKAAGRLVTDRIDGKIPFKVKQVFHLNGSEIGVDFALFVELEPTSESQAKALTRTFLYVEGVGENFDVTCYTQVDTNAVPSGSRRFLAENGHPWIFEGLEANPGQDLLSYPFVKSVPMSANGMPIPMLKTTEADSNATCVSADPPVEGTFLFTFAIYKVDPAVMAVARTDSPEGALLNYRAFFEFGDANNAEGGLVLFLEGSNVDVNSVAMGDVF